MCVIVLLSYCRLGSTATAAATASLVAAIAANTTTPGTTAVAAAQWSVSNANNRGLLASSAQAVAPAAAEVSYTSEEIPRLAEYSASMYAKTPEEHNSYLQYYTQYYTNQLATLKPSSKSEPTVSPPDLSKFVYDEKSAYYYDSVSNLYYDSNTQYFYNPQTKQFSYWDSEKNNFVPVASPETAAASAAPVQDKEEKKEKPEKQDKVISVDQLN